MTARWIRWPDSVELPDGTRSPESSVPRMGYGADYNPEQWPEAVWEEDVRLMREAGVNIVSVGIFSWALLQPTEDSWDFAWLDRALDLLHRNGIAVDLATATASPPPWLTTLHPEILPVTRSGETLWPGARQQWRPTSPVFRSYALALVTAIAERYADHPALAMWHVNNELGCHNVYDYSDDAAAAFRVWLEARYGTLPELNRAWGTAFWSQNYSRWAEILPPRLAAANPNPTHQLDFARFSSDALRDYLVAERSILHRITPGVPVTTNFMVMGETKGMDYAGWASEVDIVSNDHYLMGDDPLAWQDLSFSANLTGNLTGEPWFLMEHSTSAVNWQNVNLPKTPGQMRMDSLSHVAHGADAVCFFQWRQSLAGAEKFHSAMVPHAGEDSAVFRGVVGLGRDLAALSELVGTHTTRARIAILFDWESWWASELDSHPSSELRYKRVALEWYTAAVARGLDVDVLPATSTHDGLDDYAVVIAPLLYLAPEGLAEALENYARGGGHLVVTFFSGIADRDDHIFPGGYPGAYRDLLGVRVEEFGPVLAGTAITLDTGAGATLWSENVRVADDVEVLARFADGPFPTVPAVTRRTVGAGSATYVATLLDAEALETLVGSIAEHAGVRSRLDPAVQGRVELVSRESATHTYTFLFNHAQEELTVTGLDGTDMLGGSDARGGIVLETNGVAILRAEREG
jgi:beta-galactosidase